MNFDLPIKMYCDNMAAISICHNPVQHDRTKHVEIDRNVIRENINDGIINLKYIPSREQIGDVFTKGLSKDKFEYFIGKLGMFNIYGPT